MDAILKLFRKSSQREKFKKLERQVKKGQWFFVFKIALFWSVSFTLLNILLEYLMGLPVTEQSVLVRSITSFIFGLPLGFLCWAQLKRSYANQRKRWKLDVWGTGIFDDAGACDVINTAIHKNQTIDVLIEKALSVAGSDRIGSTEAYEVIVAGAMSDAKINNVSYKAIDDLDAWLDEQESASVLQYKANLIKALERVLSDESDLNEMWSEKVDGHPEWRSHIKKLIASLDSA